MSSERQAARIAGILFILAAVTAIIGLALYGPVLNQTDYVIKGPALENQVKAGALAELILAFSVIGISIAVYPTLKKYSESLALGYVCARLLEATIIIVGIISILSVLTLSRAFATAGDVSASAFLATSRSLVAIHDWTFLFGPDFALAPSTLIMAYLLFTRRLAPRFIAILGLVGGSLIFVSAVLVLFGAFGQTSPGGAALAIPIFVYEMTLAVWLIARGFKEPSKAAA